MLYYKETGEPFYSAGLLLPEVEIIGDKSKVNPWAASGRHNTSSYWDPNGVVHGFDKSVEAAINYPAIIMKQNGYDASGYYDKVSKIGKAMTTLSPIRWIGTLRVMHQSGINNNITRVRLPCSVQQLKILTQL